MVPWSGLDSSALRIREMVPGLVRRAKPFYAAEIRKSATRTRTLDAPRTPARIRKIAPHHGSRTGTSYSLD